jgi:hypothetical protein
MANPNGIATGRIVCALANTPYNLPDIAIPDGHTVRIRTGNVNAGLILISENRSTVVSLDATYALPLNQDVPIKISNASLIWVSATVAGDTLSFIVERPH